ncbi:DUF6223 family protein [Streptomyces labedae]|uniref:Uncharacterized protein n=1 Tax=Streptomyces labedae TaxID=285569 RepID=A0ABP6R239_9ACTN
MSAPAALLAAEEGGIIGDGRTGADLALVAGALGVALARLATSRAGRRVNSVTPRTAWLAAMVTGAVGTVLAVLHAVTTDGGPGTGNGLVGAVVAVPLGLGAVLLGPPGSDPRRRADRPARRMTVHGSSTCAA